MVFSPPFPKNYASDFLVLDYGEGSWLYDAGGKKYLDFGSGIAVNALGHGRRDLAKAAYRQMLKVTHVSNLYTTGPALNLARELVASGPFAAVHFGNSGSEANEAALKYSRAWSLRVKGPDHYKILAFQNSFHGRTLGSLSATYTEKYRKPFEPLLPGVEFAVYNDVAGLSKVLNASFAAVIVEPIQGEGGLTMMTPEFAAELNRLCEMHQILLIADEIQTGVGRTGSLYAHTALGLKPDIVTLAKPLAGGLPLSATLISEKVNAQIHVGDHGTTFGGGPVTTAVALKVWDLIRRKSFLEEVAEKGEFLKHQLEKLTRFSFVSELRGKGLLQGVALKLPEGEENPMPAFIEEAKQNGLLILRSGANVIRIAPPLTITKQEIEKGVDRLKKVLAARKGDWL